MHTGLRDSKDRGGRFVGSLRPGAGAARMLVFLVVFLHELFVFGGEALPFEGGFGDVVIQCLASSDHFPVTAEIVLLDAPEE